MIPAKKKGRPHQPGGLILKAQGVTVMWGCDYSPISGGWWGNSFTGNLWSLLISALVILLVVYLAIRAFRPPKRNARGSFRDRVDSEAILKARFARGEISREEFIKMKQTLSQP